MGGIVETRIRTITLGIPVHNLAEAIDWYRSLLGPREELDPYPGIKEFELLENFWLQLLETKDQGIFPILRFGVDDADREHRRLSNLGIEVEPIQDEPTLLRYFGFRDPWGNRLYVYQLP